MSPRRNKPRPARGRGGPRPDSDDDSSRAGSADSESWQGEDYLVRQISGTAADKHYRCPGCDQEIRPGTPHLVAWPEHGGAERRRHWHTACWKARERRGARLQRSRDAPRY